MNKNYYFIYFEPEDWVAFREVRRFGYGSFAQTIYPSTFPFYGAIRSALLKLHNVELEYHKKPNIPEKIKELIGDENTPGKIKLIGPFIYSEEKGRKKHYFPAPKNVYIKNGEYKTMQYLNYKTQVEELELDGLAWIPEINGVESPEESYIELEELEKYKQGQNFKLENPDNIVVESKFGIALEKSEKRVKETMLYTLNTYRFKNGGFFMITDSEETKQEIEKLDGVFLGAKQRWARVTVEKVNTSLFDKPTNIGNGKTAIMLITPAIYDGGVVPSDLKFGNSKILTLSSGKKITISGWDFANGYPKKIHHAVAPGTVYYLDKTPNENEVINKSTLNLFGFGRFIYIMYEEFQKNNQ